MKKFFGILFLFTLLYSCETPVAHIPPADELKDGYKRYNCRFVDEWQNNNVKYYFFDINLNKKIGLFNFATYYEGKKPSWNRSIYFTYIDNQKASFKNGNSLTTFYHKSGDLSYDGKIYARCSLWEDRSIIVAKTEPKKKETKKTTTETKPERRGEEKSLEETLSDIFGDRKLDKIEGLWGYQREGEDKARIYIIIKSENYLYEEIVVFHPVERFVDEISTRIIKKINDNSYKIKGTWLNKHKEEWQREGKITFMSKNEIKFEYKETCHTNDDCFKESIYYKQKIWPPETYTDEMGLDEEQTEKLKNLIE
tara:strand:- start:2186 stop:3115 length:930 start_codon:yes stop_codon:yes gene_type:complete